MYRELILLGSERMSCKKMNGSNRLIVIVHLIVNHALQVPPDAEYRFPVKAIQTRSGCGWYVSIYP